MVNINEMTFGDLRQIADMFRAVMRAESAVVPQPAAQPCTGHKEKPVVVWTDKRGVIFGYTENVDARPIVLRSARMCLYWPTSVGGVFGLCDIGPNKDSKISAVLPSATFEGVTGVADVTAEAEKAWVSAKVQGR